MPDTTPQFDIDDAKSFDENMAIFQSELLKIDQNLGATLNPLLIKLADGSCSKEQIWDALKTAVEEAPDP